MLSSDEYAGDGGVRCPVCDSYRIEGDGSVEINDGSAAQPVRCLDCKAVWIDEYNLTGYIGLKTA